MSLKDMTLKGSKTEKALKDAFAEANKRYLHFAAKADAEDHNDVAAVFRTTTQGKTGHAHGHLEYLDQVGDSQTSLAIGGTSDNLRSGITLETRGYAISTRAWQNTPVKKTLTKLPIGLKHWRKQNDHMPQNFEKPYTF